MLNGKKILTQILLWISGLGIQTINLSSVTIAANGSGNSTGDISQAGKQPLGILGVAKSGGGSGDVLISAYYLTGSSAVVSLRNFASASRTITCTVNVLYKKA